MTTTLATVTTKHELVEAILDAIRSDFGTFTVTSDGADEEQYVVTWVSEYDDEVWSGASNPGQVEWLDFSQIATPYGPQAAGIQWPTGAHYTYEFHPSEYITTDHHVIWHLGQLIDDFIEGDESSFIAHHHFSFATADIVDFSDPDSLIGWALIARQHI